MGLYEGVAPVREAKYQSLSQRLCLPTERGRVQKLEVTNCDLKLGWRRYAPFAFTEQGIAMLSSVLRSERSIAVNIAIIRVFVRLRQLLATNEDIRHKLDELERRMSDHDQNFAVVFDAIRQLMVGEEKRRRRPRIGYLTEGHGRKPAAR